jgi:hypothetical protein
MLTDDVVILAPLTGEDATEWLAGQDEESSVVRVGASSTTIGKPVFHF